MSAKMIPGCFKVHTSYTPRPGPSPVRFSEMIFSGEAAAVDFFGGGLGWERLGHIKNPLFGRGIHLGSG